MRFEISDKRRQAVKLSDFRMTAGGGSVYFLNRGELSQLCFARDDGEERDLRKEI